MLRLPFTSDAAKEIDQEIFETCILQRLRLHGNGKKGRGTLLFLMKGSPISMGGGKKKREFQHNLWVLKMKSYPGDGIGENCVRKVKERSSHSLLVCACLQPLHRKFG